MKKQLLIGLFVCAIVPAAMSQISGGVRLGANIANQKFDAEGLSISPDSKLGLLGGLYLTASLSDKIGIQPELYFSSMGSKLDVQGFESTTKLNYLSLPVLVRYNFTENISLQAGPQLGFLLSAKGEVDGTSEDIKDSFKGLDLGAAIGLGVDFGPFNGGLRYVLGLANTSDESDPDGGDFTVKNNSLQIFVGYRLFGGK